MLPSSDDCGDCRPGGRTPGATAIAFSSVPFIATFLLVSTIVLQKIFPILSGDASSSTKQVSFSLSPPRLTARKICGIAFSTTIALAAVLAELILCEISNTIDPFARQLAFHFTIGLLLLLLVVVIPSLEIHSVISAAGWEYTGKSKSRLRFAWILQATVTTIWLIGFWWTGGQLLGKTSNASPPGDAKSRTISEACLSRVGVIGISLMAVLSGFASVSAPWQNIFSKPVPVTETSVARKAAGLSATNDMLLAKQSRLRALERKMSDIPQDKNIFQKAIGSIRGNTDRTELRALEMEIKGLEAMALSLSTSHHMLQSPLPPLQIPFPIIIPFLPPLATVDLLPHPDPHHSGADSAEKPSIEPAVHPPHLRPAHLPQPRPHNLPRHTAPQHKGSADGVHTTHLRDQEREILVHGA